MAATATIALLAPLLHVSGRALASRAVVYLPNVLPRLDLATLLGPASKDAPMNLVVALAHPDTAGEEAAYRAIYDPANPAYHHFLTPAAFNARFGVTSATVAAATKWLSGGGLRIVQVSAPGDLIQVQGTVATVGRLFHSPIGSYEYQGTRFLANTTPPAIPYGLPVATVVGLNTLQRFRPFAQPPASGGTFSGTFNERDLWKIYDAPDSNYGEGQSLAIFGAGDTDPVVANLRVFEQRQGLPQTPVRVVRTEPGAYGDVSGGVEWNLDSQASTGMAPMASQLSYYFGNAFFDSDFLTMFSAWASDPHGPLQGSASFGECETNPLNPLLGGPLLYPKIPFGNGLGDNAEVASEPILRQATLEGRTLFAATGDTAGLCPAVLLPIVGALNGIAPGTAPFQSYPAVSKYVVAVGGTVVTSDAARTYRVSETSWTYTGGGPSAFVSEPSFQKRVGPVNRPCLVDPTGKLYPPGTTCRGVPDIAADSSGGIPGVVGRAQYNVVEDMVDTGAGGTSLSSPLALGMWTRIQAGAPPGGLGFANESLYRLAAGPHYHRDFYDVTASEFGLGNITNQPGPGYDYTSGLGVMDVAHLMDDLTGRRTPLVRTSPAAVAAPPLGGDCRPVFTSPPGNVIDPVTLQGDGALDFTSGGLAVTPDHRSLEVSMTGPTLAPSLSPSYLGGSVYLVFWTYKGQTYFAEAQVTPPGGVAYSDGHVDHANGLVVDHAITGTFALGRLQMTVPLADVGKPALGSRLEHPYGVVQGLVGVPGVPVLSFTVDAGSNADYQLGFRCRPS